jgi:hypothetical protein
MLPNPFVGTWRLVSAETIAATGEVIHPFGDAATGYLIYSEDGHMATVIMQANRSNFATADLRAGSLEEKVAAFDTYASYFGKYEVRDHRVIHRIEASLFPNWTGTDQERSFEFAGDHPLFAYARHNSGRSGSNGASDLAALDRRCSGCLRGLPLTAKRQKRG